jgi:hypothetical protein
MKFFPFSFYFALRTRRRTTTAAHPERSQNGVRTCFSIPVHSSSPLPVVALFFRLAHRHPHGSQHGDHAQPTTVASSIQSRKNLVDTQQVSRRPAQPLFRPFPFPTLRDRTVTVFMM